MTDYTTYCPDSVLFERNPVCGVCWRVCKEMSEEWGGTIQFDLLASIAAADGKEYVKSSIRLTRKRGSFFCAYTSSAHLHPLLLKGFENESN